MSFFQHKILIGFTVLAVTLSAFVFPQPKNAYALFGIDGCFIFCPLQLAEDTISAGANLTSAGADVVTGGATTATVGTTGVTAGVTTSKLIVDGTPIERAITDTVLSPTICDQFANANLLLDTIDSVGNTLAGSDKAQLSNTFFISYKVESTRSQLRDCWMPLELISQTAKGGTNSQAQNLEANRTLIAQKKQTLTLQLTDYEKQKKESLQDVFEAIAFNFAMEAYKQVTVKGVNELVDKLKINGYLEYADALATQVYSVDYIKKNFSQDKQRELIAASLFKSQALNDIPAFNNAVAIAKQKASQYNKYADQFDWNNPKYWGDVAGAADERAWPEYQMMVGFGDAQAARVNGIQNAQAEIQNGKGFKGMRNCKDVTSQQAQIDKNLTDANIKVEQAQVTLTLLYSALNYKQSDVDKAKQDLDNAIAEAKRIQNSSNGGLAKSCDAITQPANFLAETTSDWLSSFIKQNAEINTANTTLFGTLATKLSTSLFKDIINGKGGSALKELGGNLIPIGVAGGLQGIIGAGGSSGDPNTGTSGIVIGDGATMVVNYKKLSGNKLEIEIKFETSDDVVPKSFQVVITEVSNPAKKTTNIIDILPSDFDTANGLVTGKVILDDVIPAKNSNYAITFRGLKRSVGVTLFNFATASVVVPAGTVAGVTTTAPSYNSVPKTNVFMPRGPEVNNFNYRY